MSRENQIMSTKAIVIAAVLIIGAGISIYLWTSNAKEAGGDQNVMGMMQKYVCGKCSGNFEMSVENVAKERRTNDGNLKCPLCGAENPEKQDVKVRIGGMGGGASESETKGFDSDEGVTEDEDKPAEESKPKLSAPGMRKKKD